MKYWPEKVANAEQARDKIDLAVRKSFRQFAVYYSAGRDIPTAIHSLWPYTSRIIYVDHRGFDWLAYPGNEWLNRVFADFGIALDRCRIEPRHALDVTYRKKQLQLEFVRADNAMYANYGGAGGIIYVTGLAGAWPSELLINHTRRSHGVLAFNLGLRGLPRDRWRVWELGPDIHLVGRCDRHDVTSDRVASCEPQSVPTRRLGESPGQV